MQINDADVAELVDARDLKSRVAAENVGLSCKTDTAAPADMAADPVCLQNNFTLPVLLGALARARRKLPVHPRAIASNLVEMIGNLENYIRPSWATHEAQTLPWKIKEQMERFERAMGGSK